MISDVGSCLFAHGAGPQRPVWPVGADDDARGDSLRADECEVAWRGSVRKETFPVPNGTGKTSSKISSASSCSSSTGVIVGTGSGTGSPAKPGTPRDNLTARYFGGRERRGSGARSSASVSSMTSVSRRRCRARAGSRSGRATAMPRQRSSAISSTSTRFRPETGR